YDHDIGAAEEVVVLLAPLAGSAGIGGGNVAERGRGLGVALAFAHQYEIAAGDALDKLGQPIEHPAHAFDRPYPTVLDRSRIIVRACRATLTETLLLNLGVEAHHLEQQRAVFVVIGIGRADGLATTV